MRRCGSPWPGPRERADVECGGHAAAIGPKSGGVAAALHNSPRACAMQPEPSMSPLASAPVSDLDRASLEFYQHAMRLMDDGNLPFLVGGAYAFGRYTGIERHTKDFDVFIRREDFDRACKLFEAAG